MVPLCAAPIQLISFTRTEAQSV